MSLFSDAINLSGIVTPYIFHPLSGLEVFLPHAWPVTWLNGSKSFVPERDLLPLQGKVILVTGGNAGLGKETVYQLALSRPDKIYLAARSRTKGEEAVRQVGQLLNEAGDASHCEIEFLELDLCDLGSVRKAAKSILRQESRLDVLILNAGIMAIPSARTDGGHDLQLGTNHVGHFLLTKLLLPLLEQTASRDKDSDVRIVTVSSEAHRMAPPDFLDMIEEQDKLCSASPYTRYGVSKAANIVFAAELARRYEQKNIQSVSVHPGLILTNLYSPTRNANFVANFGLPSMASLFFDDVKHGALNQIWCAAGAEREQLVNGAYYTPVGRLRYTPLVEDEAAGGRLWDWPMRQIEEYLD